VAAKFPTTQWSRVLTARDRSNADARRALETLCQTYWHPLFVFVRRQGYDPDAARDLVQAYFTELLEKDFLKDVAPERGRFRSFLLASLKHFLSHDRERAAALKRGGHVQMIPLDATTEDLVPGPAKHRTPEQIYERQWALTVLDQALERLRQEVRDAQGEAQFEALKPYLTGDAGRAPYREVAEQLGMNEGAVRGAVLRLRKRFGKALRAQVAETVADPADVDDEIRRMLTVIRPWGGEQG
jgi:RNA polymerase sigma-70 factor (ECF subfamily)